MADVSVTAGAVPNPAPLTVTCWVRFGVVATFAGRSTVPAAVRVDVVGTALETRYEMVVVVRPVTVFVPLSPASCAGVKPVTDESVTSTVLFAGLAGQFTPR